MNKKPGLILALPRSGTNWTVDALKVEGTRILQEPLWLHNGGQYEQNPLHPMRASTVADVSAELGHKALANDPYGQLLTKNFLAWINETDGRNHLFKETDGFFHLEWLLASIPDLKILLIQRDIRGIVSSFKKGDLFEKWGYRARLRELLRTIQASSKLDTLYGEIISRRNINERPWIALTYYLGASMLEIRRQIERKTGIVLETKYEELLTNPEDTFSDIAEMLGVENISAIIERVRQTIAETRAESTHSTRKRKSRDSFEKYLTTQEAEDICSIWRSLGLEIDQPSTNHYFVGNSKDWNRPKEHNYTTCNTQNRESIFEHYHDNKVIIPGSDNTWISNTLVTNIEYANFINWLQSHGIRISINGRNIFYNDRPQSKIHLVDGNCVINIGFEDHLATHMNLIGAASFAKWLGGRLPIPKEIEKICFPHKDSSKKIDKTRANFGHHYPGTTPVKYFAPNDLGIYDPVGNVGTWTSARFAANNQDVSSLEYVRMCGAWSKDIGECYIENTKVGRPWWMAASTLGLRPVFNGDSLPDPNIALDEITELLEKLQNSSIAPDQKNQIVHKFITQ